MSNPESRTVAEELQRRLEQQLAFVLEVDRLKQIQRRTEIIGGARAENSAEHSWHLAVMALVLAEHANHDDLDVRKVLGMVLVHDLVEIDVGDTFLYDGAERAEVQAREQRAADRIFSLLPTAQGRALRGLWDEFEQGGSAEACFARALDRFQPLILNYANKGALWQRYAITRQQIEDGNIHIREGSDRLWEHAKAVLSQAVASGLLADDPSA